MPLTMLPGESLLHEVHSRKLLTRRRVETISVTTHRLGLEEFGWFSFSNRRTTILPLEKIDSVQEGHTSLVWLLLIAAILLLGAIVVLSRGNTAGLLALLPAAICVVFWFLTRKQTIIFETPSGLIEYTAGGLEELGVRDEQLLDTVESARRACIREFNASSPAPVRVGLVD